MSPTLVKPVPTLKSIAAPAARAPNPAAVLAIILASYLMIVLDVSVVIAALPKIQTTLRLLAHRPLLGAERLHADVRRPAAARRARRRHPRPPPHARDRRSRSSPSPRSRAAWRRRPSGCWPRAPCRASAPRSPRRPRSRCSRRRSARAASAPARSRYYSAVAGGGGSVGLVLGGMLTDWLSWRWGLFINVPVGLAVIVARAALPARDRAAHRALRPRRAP